MDGFCYDFDEFYYMNDCEEGVDCLRRIISKYVVNEYNINRIFYVSDNDLEDKFRSLLRDYTVVQIRSLCKRMKVRKVSGIKKKHELIEAIISWIMKHNCRECELRSVDRTNLTRLADHFGVDIGPCVDGDDVIDRVLEVVDKNKADWRWIFEFESESE